MFIAHGMGIICQTGERGLAPIKANRKFLGSRGSRYSVVYSLGGPARRRVVRFVELSEEVINF